MKKVVEESEDAYLEKLPPLEPEKLAIEIDPAKKYLIVIPREAGVGSDKVAQIAKQFEAFFGKIALFVNGVDLVVYEIKSAPDSGERGNIVATDAKGD